MTRPFLLSAALGFAVTFGVLACASGPAACPSSEVASGAFSIVEGDAEGRPQLVGGSLQLDLAAGEAKIIYPDRESSVTFRLR